MPEIGWYTTLSLLNSSLLLFLSFIAFVCKVFEYLLACLTAVHDRHIDVENDQIKVVSWIALHSLQCLIAIDRLFYLFEVLFELVFKDGQKEVVVVRQKTSLVRLVLGFLLQWNCRYAVHLLGRIFLFLVLINFYQTRDVPEILRAPGALRERLKHLMASTLLHNMLDKILVSLMNFFGLIARLFDFYFNFLTERHFLFNRALTADSTGKSCILLHVAPVSERFYGQLSLS